MAYLMIVAALGFAGFVFSFLRLMRTEDHPGAWSASMMLCMVAFILFAAAGASA